MNKKILLSLTLCMLIASLIGAASNSAFASEHVPVAENIEFQTYINTSLKSNLKASDSESDIVSYILTTNPIKGTITLEQDGSFIYTPEDRKKGRDYFGYKVIDSAGNSSQEGTVIIRINKK